LRLRICLLASLFILLIAAFGPKPTQAHGYIVRTVPASRAILAQSPTRLSAWFSEGLEPRFSTLRLSNEQGDDIALTDNAISPTNTAQISARIAQPLAEGVYILTMRIAFASDGHVYTERLIFWVGQPAEGSAGLAANSDQRTALPLEVFWRALSLPALNVLFGLSLLYLLILRPAWRNPSYAAGQLPPRLMMRLAAIGLLAAATALVGTLLALLQQSMALFGASPELVLREGLWLVVLNTTQIGEVLRWRLIFALGSGLLFAGSLYYRRRAPYLVYAFWQTSLLTGAGGLFTLSASSHAAGADLWQLTSVLVHWLHILANSAWVGGLIGLAFSLPLALAPLAADSQRAAALAALRRFAGLGVVALIFLAATGLYNAGIQLRQPQDLTNTAYGIAFVGKLLLILPLLGLALYHHLLCSDDWLSQALAGLAVRLRRQPHQLTASLRVESGLGVLVLAAAALMAATPPPIPANAGQISTPSQQQQLGALSLQATLDPGGVGANTYNFSLSQAGQPVAEATLRAQMTFPALDKHGPLSLADSAEGGVYLLVGTEVDRPGLWWQSIDVQLPDGTSQRFAFAWQISETPPTLAPRAATLINMVGLWAVLGALAICLLPVGRKAVAKIGFQRWTLAFAVAGVAVTIPFLLAIQVILQNSYQQLDRNRNPIPAVINPTLPDQASLVAGAALFEANCAACHNGGIGPNLSLLVGKRRDADIYQLLQAGRGQMPAFNGWPEADYWHVINYVRGLAQPE
jgi:copper transport protein